LRGVLEPDDQQYAGRGAASGYWAAYLKQAGYDGIVIQGAAKSPQYLFINDGKPELRNAREFLGQRLS